MNLTAWPGRGYLPDLGEAVATYWEKVGIRVKRRPLDRAVFAADFRARAYSGVALAYASPVVGPEPWDILMRISHTKGAVQLFFEHPKLDEFLDRLATQPSYGERVRIMRDEMGPGSRLRPRRRHRGHPRHRGGGAEGGGMAPGPRPHGVPQLGVRDPGALAHRGQTACTGICSAGSCRRC